MVTKAKTASAGKGHVKVGKLQLNRETVKNLTDSEQKGIKGGVAPKPVPNPVPITVVFGSCAAVSCGDTCWCTRL